MGIRDTMEEALQRGESIKDRLLQDILGSKKAQELMQNESFLKSLGKILSTHYEIKDAIRSNLQSFLKNFNLPSRDEVSVMERKVRRLENEVEGIQRKVMANRLSQVAQCKSGASSKKKQTSCAKTAKTTSRKKRS